MSSLSDLGEILYSQMQKVQKDGETTLLELGIIDNEFALSVDSLKDKIPQGDYLISLHLSTPFGDALHSRISAHTHHGGDHMHDNGTHNHDGGGHVHDEHTGGEHTHNGGNHVHNGGTHSHHDGEHGHLLPESLRGIQPGDRVLVAWIDGQPMVLDIVAESGEINGK